MLKFTKQFAVYGFASVLGKIAAVFLLPFYTRVLSEEEYGAMAMIVASKGIIDLFSNLNIHSGVARDYYEKAIDRVKLISTGFFSILFFSIFVLTILYISKNFWINNVLNVAGYEKAFIVMLLTLPAGSLFSYFAILTRFKQKAVFYSIGTSLQLIIQIALTIYFVLFLKTGIVGVFYGIFFGEIVGIFYFALLNREYVTITFSFNLIKKVLIFSLPTLPAIFAIWADSSVGQILIGKYISIDDAGIYSIALRIASVFLLLQTAFGNVWLPFVYERYNHATFRKTVFRMFHTATIMLIIVSVNISLLSDYLVVLLSTPNYIEAGTFLSILTIPMSISILSEFSRIGPNITRKTKYVSYASMSGSVINILLLIFFLPIYGVISVPISLGISRIISYSMVSYFTFREISLLFPPKNVIILIFAIVSCFIIKYAGLSNILVFTGLTVFNILMMAYIYQSYGISGLFLRRRKAIGQRLF
ncbi:MAG: oligosaccharide flippase family protein [Actinomycetia bacterium]|nr:oligosaccharide flippase family protein [Actinomycetes bacterium]